jgi:hypothetical protein
MIFVGLNFASLSNGLASNAGAEPFYCRNLKSSGSDDDVMIFAFSVFLVPFLLRLVRIKRWMAKFEAVNYFLCLGLVALALIVASMDCADVFYTAFVVPDLLLSLALISALLSAVLVLLLSRMRETPQSNT